VRAVWLLGLLALGCDTVDIGKPLADVNACRPPVAFFLSDVWPNFLNKTYGDKRCSNAGCHDSGSARQLVLTPPTSMPATPLPPDWAMVYRSVTEQLLCTNVDSSPLLTRPDGRQSHGGGKLIDPEGPEATLVKMWVGGR
jgi:predicted CxxxxCH...CXXCH cytochrome family protein